ncbi:amidohydrolase [Leifsonia sp. F6_8S_P_1B]|uniref:Amidohydrolase n=1 Tax=Leifsonia williamsii TaxID=3035919 RepID=A0ABT8KIA8_9MICO|nr:amidohydrolase [Leifsonia williamsii]MDN4616034.1 amidohydrolase [Leifsonia williamsii]
MTAVRLHLAFVNGDVFDGVSDAPARMDVGVADGRVVALGAEVADRIGPETRVVDLTGRMLLPGLIDAHVHPVEAGVERLNCDLSAGWTRDDYLATIRAYADAHPEQEWIVGGGWQQAAFPGGAPLAADLDAVVPDRPVVMSNRDHHSAWVNSAALRALGIDASTPDPADGRIERDADGAPTGTLHEGARTIALRAAPQPTIDDQYAGLLEAQRHLHSFGITGWQDALIGDYGNHTAAIVDVYRRAIDEDTLRARVNGAIWWEREVGEEQIARIDGLRRRHQDERFRVTTVKVMQDGIVENQTAAMIHPYCSGHAPAGAHSDGISFVDPERLQAYVTRLDELGLQVHFHAIGDRGVRESLDAVAAARAANGPGGRTHHIAHLQVVHPDDHARFAQLDVAANIQALWACYDPQMVELNIPLLGAERTLTQYPFGSLLRAGARLAAGSDWPVTTPDPWLAMHVAVNRRLPDGHPDSHPDVFLPAERIGLADALRAYTSGAAHINGRADRTGSIAVGSWADLAVVDRNPFDGPADDIARTRTIETLFAGETVYSAADA